MAWSLVGLFAGFFFPLLAFLISHVVGCRRDYPQKEKAPALLAGFAALASSATLLLLIFSSSYWSKGARLVWTGMQAHSQPLTIGGRPEETAIGWPHEAVFPRLKVTPRSDTSALVEVAGGGAFVYDEQGRRFLNGTPVAVGQTAKFGEYQIRVNRLGLTWRPWLWLSKEVEVLDAGGQKLAGFSLRPDRTRNLRYLLAGRLETPLTRVDRLVEREKLEGWAGDVWLVRADAEKVYVLTSDELRPSECALPADLTVKWANLTLPVRVSAADKTTTLAFSSPWRLSAPIPDAAIAGCPEPKPEEAGKRKLIVAARAHPCEMVFGFPFGRSAGDVRQAVTLDPTTHKFNSPGAVDHDIPVNCPPGVKCETRRVGTSEVNVEGGGHVFTLNTVRDLPSRKGIAALIALSFCLFLGGLYLLYPRLPRTNRFVAYGIVTAVWLFLALRLLLAFRYALDPAGLDRLAVNGIKRAFFGLLVVPALLILWTRLRADRAEPPATPVLARRAMRLALYYLLAAFVCGLVGLYFPSRLWSGLPPAYHLWLGDTVTSLSGLSLTFVCALITILLALHIKFLYEPDEKGILVRLFVDPWYLAERYLPRARQFWADHLGRTTGQMVKFVLGGAIIFLGAWLAFLIASSASLLPGDKTVQELVTPIVFYWIAILWVGLKLHLQTAGGETLPRRQALWLMASALILISLPAIAVPFAIFDFGSILPVLAIMLPLIAILLAGRSRVAAAVFLAAGALIFVAGLLLPALVTLLLLLLGLLWGLLWGGRRAQMAGLAVAFGVALLFVLGGFVYQNLEGMILPNVKGIPVVGSQGRVFARLLNYKKGIQAQQNAILANSSAGGEGLPYQELLNGNQHTWENKAIAHEGDWWGAGFGEAPVHRSQVRRDTLQYDSVFSFFIVSEYGFVGGLLLLLMYAFPMTVIFLGGRDRLDAGYGLALVVGGAFLIESLYHAGMNLSAFPMTGRNLPLLSVNSPSDLLRWALLWGFALQAIFWRYGGGGRVREGATSLTADDADEGEGTATAFGGGWARAAERGEAMWPYAVAVWLIPAITALAVLANGWGVLREEKELERFSYEPLLGTVRWYLEEGVITFDERGKKLDLKEARLGDPDEQDFIQQEIARFNARTDDEKREELEKKREEEFRAKLARVGSARDYQNLLAEISVWRQGRPLRSVFRLVPMHDERGRIESHKVTINPDFNVSYSFKVGRVAADLPRITYGEALLLGPAWVSGRYETAISPVAPLPWVAYLRDAMEVEWLRLKREDPALAAKRYGTLTLNKAVHEAAMRFTAAKGMKLHDALIKGARGGDFTDRLPPRVALAVISLPNGETRALGGWPRMTTLRNSWERVRTDAGEFWVPPARWLESDGPQSINARYRGDRNFDRGVLMGSSTKPIWAAAALRVHPRLPSLLQVRPGGGEENSVFGLEIQGKPWGLNSGGDEWVGFRRYLRKSDNRYQVRLGFLGLAEANANGFLEGGPSPSRDESVRGNGKAWERYPKFPAPFRLSTGGGQLRLLSFGPNPSEPNLTLANSEMATALRDMFSVGVKGIRTAAGERREFSFRRSFWTLDENDDFNGNTSRATALLNQIAPEAPDFAFDRLYKPRDYVTMLLGGGNNSWANVDLAAAFATCLSGKPVLAHIVRGQGPVRTLDGRKKLAPDLALPLHPGLREVAEDADGTAFQYLAAARVLDKFKGYTFYAKTGTLNVEDDESALSRLVLAIVKWKDEKKGEIASGLVFSVVAERGGQGTAARWLNEFLVNNKDAVATMLAAQK